MACPIGVFSQRSYAPNSILATGNWVKIGVTQNGIYKIDAALLNSWGLGQNINSSSIKLYGNGAAMLEEKVATYTDDLLENAIEVVDGGDGIFNGNDYILFVGLEPGKWINNDATKQFSFQKNLYTDTTYYFITVQGTNGKRISNNNFTATPTMATNNYTYRYHYELDSINFLNSGKNWYGQEFSTTAGNSLSRTFAVNLPSAPNNANAIITSNLLSRSINSSSNFAASVNNSAAQNVVIPAISGGFLDVFANTVQQQNIITVNQANTQIQYTYNRGNANAQGWLNWFSLQLQLPLQLSSNGVLFFRDYNSVGNAAVSFTLNNTNATTQVWDISTASAIQKISTSFTAGQTSFVQPATTLKEYIAFNIANASTPFFCGSITNQNIHNSTPVDYIIFTHSNFINAANNLAAFHTRHYKYKVAVINVQQVFNEFSSGIPDPTAIRDCIKMYYDKYKFAATSLKYVCFFGAASYDYKKRVANNTNFVPAFQTDNSLNPLASHTSDDFFALLQDGDDVNNLQIQAPLLQIGIGRIPCKNILEATTVVNKIINYHNANTFGEWKNEAVFIADDGDGNIHLNDAELMAATTQTADTVLNANKIYVDAFEAVSNSGGARYPAVNNAIVNKFFTGAFLINYTGHGGYQRLADEAIFTFDELKQLNNARKLPLVITATCDFVPYDDPTKTALGTELLVGSANGAIALTTTTRLVFAFSNRIMNNNYLQIAMQPNASNQYLTLGDAIKNAKNFTYQTFADVFNNRKFTLIGDPAMRLSFPTYNIKNTSIVNTQNQLVDTLKAGELYTFKGAVQNNQQTIATNFNGTVTATVFGQPSITSTLANSSSSVVANFTQQKNILFKGKSTVTNGQYSFSFVVPKDAGFVTGKGKLSVYAQSDSIDAAGASNNFVVGGNNNTLVTDNTPPTIQLFLNDTLFKNGGITHSNAILIGHLFDESGINTLGTAIGHDITVALNGDNRNAITVNNFYSTTPNTYKQGTVVFPLNNLPSGKHTLTLKAWDVFNNSATQTIAFEVVNNTEATFIGRVFNYPNPVVNSGTTFSFEHNLPSQALQTQLEIYTTHGKKVLQQIQQVQSNGTRNCQLFWDGKTSSSTFLQNGVYFYRIIVQANNGEQQMLSGSFIKQ
jgi:hypothetical protein